MIYHNAMPGRRKGARRGKGWFGDKAKAFAGKAWGAIKDVAKAAHESVKESKVISKTLRDMGHDITANTAEKLGYGRRRRRARGRGSQAGRGGFAIMGPMGIGVQAGWGSTVVRRSRGRGLAEDDKVIIV